MAKALLLTTDYSDLLKMRNPIPIPEHPHSSGKARTVGFGRSFARGIDGTWWGLADSRWVGGAGEARPCVSVPQHPATEAPQREPPRAEIAVAGTRCNLALKCPL